MPRKPTGNRPGRPTKPVDLARVEELAAELRTHEEIAAELNVSPDTLVKREGFSEAFKRGFTRAKGSLRAKQYHLAMTGSVEMLKHLGKHVLGQKDSTAIELTGSLKHEHVDLTKLSDAELSALEHIVVKASQPNGTAGGEGTT